MIRVFIHNIDESSHVLPHQPIRFLNGSRVGGKFFSFCSRHIWRHRAFGFFFSFFSPFPPVTLFLLLLLPRQGFWAGFVCVCVNGRWLSLRVELELRANRPSIAEIPDANVKHSFASSNQEATPKLLPTTCDCRRFSGRSDIVVSAKRRTKRE